MAGKPLCQKKRFENPVKPTFTIPKVRPNLTITKIVTPPRVYETNIVTSPKKVYPPLEPDEDILEIDLQLSDTESSESENEAQNPTIEKIETSNTNTHTNKSESHSVDKPQPIKKIFSSAGKSRLNPYAFETNNRPKNKVNVINQTRPLPQWVSRALSVNGPPSFVWPKVDPPPKRVPSPTFARFNPGLVSPTPTSTPPPTIIINNYYGNNSHRPISQCTDPAQMSRGQFKRFANRKTTTQKQINEALAIRNALKKQ